MPKSPTSRSLQELRGQGYTCQIVEKFITWTNHRIDLFGWIDIVAMKDGEQGLLGVQTTTGGHINERIKKAVALPEFKLWLSTGSRAVFHGWRKLKTPKDGRWWQVDRREITLKDLEEGGANG